ncbi:MAG: peptidoglycan DD-metalloendopeptidase family protein [Pseudomonas sp.]
MSLTAIQQWIRSSSTLRVLSAAGFSLLLAGCVSSPPGGVHVADRNYRAAAHKPTVTSGQYRVRRGDTLYAIAFRFGWDWKALAVRNSIAPPYMIRPGQIIRFYSGSNRSQQVATRVPIPIPTRSVKPPSRSGAVVQTVPRRSPPALITATAATTPVQSVKRSKSGWAWPATGVVIEGFSSNGSLNKGIDLAGELGQPILAASNGAVVYAGSGLRGYGELVIIKHSDTYVSAYGHNRRLLVKEGQQVKVGQTIAEMGSTGTDRVKLHFEIRRQGKPVNPLDYLPRR